MRLKLALVVAIVVTASLPAVLTAETASANGASTEHLTLVDDYNCSGPVTNQQCITTSGLIVTVITPSGLIHQTAHIVQFHEHLINGVVQSTLTNEIKKTWHFKVGVGVHNAHGEEVKTFDNGCEIRSIFTGVKGDTKLDRTWVDCR